MKKLVLISLLGAFLFQALSGLFILAAFYLNRDYISANVCINRFEAIPVCKGSCYLGKKLSENEQQQDSRSVELKVTVLFFDHRRITVDQPAGFSVVNTVFPLPGDAALNEGAVFPVFRPPMGVG